MQEKVETHQLEKSLIRTLVREQHQRISKSTTGRIYIPELARRQGLVVITNTKSTGLEARRKIGQGACVDKLSKCCGGRAAQSANHVD